MNKQHVCCLCGITFNGYGNNPWPLSHDIEDRCCDMCNDNKVIPTRLAIMKKNPNYTTEENVDGRK